MQAVDLDVAFDDLKRKSDLYARTWWLHPDSAARAFLDEHPEVRPALNQRLLSDLPTETADVYAGGSKVDWSETRVVVQREVLADLDAADDIMEAIPDGALLEESDEDAVSQDASDQSGGGDVYFVLGLPASGKTKVLRRLAALHAAGGVHSSRILPASDADDVRVGLPEYADGLGSGVVQFETVVLTYGELHLSGDGRQDRVLARRGAAIVDVIGDPTHLPRTVRLLAAAGRTCYILLTDCPVEVCQDRAKRRAVESGRLVPLWLIEDKAGVPRRALDAALATKLVAGWAVVDTSDASPRLLEGDGVFDKCILGLAEELK